MAYKKTVISTILDDLSAATGLKLNDDNIVISTRRDKLNSGGKNYDSINFYTRKKEIIISKINIPDVGCIVIKSSYNDSANHLIEFNLSLNQEKISTLTSFDTEILSTINACCEIMKFRDRKQLNENDGSHFFFDIRTYWTKNKTGLVMNTIEVDINHVIYSPDIPLDFKVSKRDNTLSNFSSNLCMEYLLISLMPDFHNEVKVPFFIKKTQKELSVCSSSFKSLDNYSEGMLSVEEAILKNKAKEFIEISQMVTI